MITLEYEEIKLKEKLRATPLHIKVGKKWCDVGWGYHEGNSHWYIVVRRPWRGQPEILTLPATVVEERVARDLAVGMLLVLSENPEIAATDLLGTTLSHLEEIKKVA